MSKITVELITENGPVNYYFVDPAAAVAFANYSREHATVINRNGQAVHVSTATDAAPTVEAVVEVVEAVVVVEPIVEEVTMDSVAEVTVDADAPVKKSRKKKE
jgi:threonine synthase